MPIGKRHFLIKPSNNTTDGFSHSKGNPVIKFSIPAQDLLLETSSLHLTGRIQFRDSAGSLISLAGNNASISDNDGGAIAQPTPVKQNLNNLGGVHNCVDKVVVKSKKSSTELVNDSNYAQYRAVQEAYSYNEDDYKRSPLNRNLSCGNNCDLLNRRIVNQFTNGGTKTERVGQEFSIKLNVPFLGRQPLHLGEDHLGGLMITLYLAPDSNVFFSRNRHLLFNAGVNGISNSYYVLKDLRLTGKYIVPDAADLKAYNPDVAFKNRVNLINDVVSSVNSNGYTPQVQFVRSISNQFQRGDAINNYALNSNNFPQVVGLQRTIQSKNGLRFPYEFPVEVKPNCKSSDQTGAEITPGTLNHPALGLGDTEVRIQYTRSLLGKNEAHHASNSLKENNDVTKEEYAISVAGTDTGNNCFVAVTGIGADYQMGVMGTQNYVNQDYALEIVSGVNSGKVNLPTDTRSQTLLEQTFINDLEVINTQSLVKSF